jgi:2,4-dienoyl-CoA reductase-like NADH-dependent reductase (Old Yellow Enzyme family)
MSETFARNDHNPARRHVDLYRRWAQGGAGILVTGNVMVSREALAEPGNVVVEDERALPMLRQWAQAGSENGAQIWMQINHPGKQVPKNLSKLQPVSPSAVAVEGAMGFAFNPPRALTTDEVHDLVQRFITTAVIAKKAGFGGVEIHAAHMYLIGQFLSPLDNQRTDQYGGSLENRMRFLTEVYTGMRAALGTDFPIGLKISSSDFTEGGFSSEDSLAVIIRMAELGIDLVEITSGNYAHQWANGAQQESFLTQYLERVWTAVTVLITVTGGFTTARRMADAVAHDEVSMVGIARGFVAYPELPQLIRDGSVHEIDLPHLHTGIASIDKMGGVISSSYYEQQMRRVARGLRPHYTTNEWGPLLFALWQHGVASLIPKRAQANDFGRSLHG